MTRSALVVGGTGPTGPHVVQGLLDRDFDVTIFHRGTHEPDSLPDVPHLHGDPHFRESIDAAVGDREYDVVVASYGRTAILAETLSGRTDHFLAIGGPPRYAGFNEPGRTSPSGLGLPVREDAPLVAMLSSDNSPAIKFAQKMVSTENAVFAAQRNATYLIYPMVYGPRNVWPWEWSVIKRISDGRRVLLVPDDGLAVHSRGGARNMAEFILLAIDRPDVAKGQVYNCADDIQYSVRQWVEFIIERMGASAEIVSVPSAVAPAVKAMYVPTSVSLCDHSLLDTSKARAELGYRDVVTAREAVDELVKWHGANPIMDPTAYPALVDRFDYQMEDQLIEAWQRAVEVVRSSVEQVIPDEVHPMPHPKKPNQGVDEKAR